MTCLFQNKTKTNGKADEDQALLPHRATSRVPIPLASFSSSFCSMSLWVPLLFEQVWGVSISAEHHWASAVLHHCSCWLCLQPRVSCMCCMHPQTVHWQQSVFRCHQHSQATWAAQGEGHREGTSAVKSWWIHLSLLNENIPHGFANRGNAAMALHSWGRSKLTWGGDFRMPQASVQAGVWAWAQGHWRFPLSFADIVCGRHWTAPALLNLLQFPLQLLVCLTCFVCCEQRTHKFSPPQHKTLTGKNAQRKDTYAFLFLKSDLCVYHYHANIYVLKIQASNLIPFPPVSACRGVHILSPS